MARFILLILCCLVIDMAAFGQATTFTYTGQTQSYTVPSCVTQLQYTIKGARGGGATAGNGATVTGTLTVIPGQVIQVRVGSQGACTAGGFNGGGIGGFSANTANAGCGGGGASDIRVAPYALANRVAVAAGGGGMGGGTTDATGGAGGCASGVAGTSPFGQGGAGGTQFSGGTGGPGWNASSAAGAPGVSGNGGNGAADPCYAVGPGGGGGGGWFGGGGGGSDCFPSGSLGGGGGGGGSSRIPTGATCVTGNVSGNGSVVLTPVGGMPLAVTPATVNACVGSTINLNASGASTYTWLPGTGLVSDPGSSQAQVTVSGPGTYEVIGTLGTCTDTLAVNVTAIPIPNVNISPAVASSCNAEPVTLTASGATTYSWSPPTGLSGVLGATVTATPSVPITYVVTGTTSGCSSTDSITIALEIEVEEAATICDGDTYVLPDGTTSGIPGVYTSAFTTAFGCDSTITTTLSTVPIYSLSAAANICQGETFTLPDGSAVSASGTYPVTLPTVYGCDSTITTVVDVHPLLSSAATFNICDGEIVVLPDGTSVGATGVYPVVLSSLVTGCDSTVTTAVNVAPVYAIDVTDVGCNDTPYVLPDGTTTTTSGVYTFGLATAAGCDSTVVVDLTLHPAYDLPSSVSVCQGQTVTLPDGSTTTSSGTYVSALTTSLGCDSTITTAVTVHPLPVISLGLAPSYCPQQTTVPLNPSPAGGSLTGDHVSGLSLQHAGVTPGTYDVSYTYTDGFGCTSSASASYILPPVITPEFTTDTYCSRLLLESLVPDPDSLLSYRWSLNNEIIAVEPISTHTYYATDTYILELEVTDQYGCVYSTYEPVLLVDMLDLTGFFLPNIVTPNGDNFNDRFVVPGTVGECLDYSIAFYNRWGDLVYTMTPGSEAFTGTASSGNELPDGVYYYLFTVERFECATTPELKEYCSGTVQVKRR